MTDLRLDVDLPHPPELVWRALTDRQLLSEWWLPTDLAPVAGETFRAFPPPQTPGMPAHLDIDVLQVEAPSVLIARWSGDELHTQVSWELVERPGGSQLRFTQNGFFGLDGASRRQELRGLYEAMFHQRLPALLDRLAGGGVELGAAVPPLDLPGRGRDEAVEPLDREIGSPPAPGRRRVRLLSLLGAAVLVVLVSSAIAVVTIGGQDSPSNRPTAQQSYGLGAGPQGGNPAASTGVAAGSSPSPPVVGASQEATPDPSASGSANPSAPESTPLPPDPSALTAGYRTVALLGLGGFDTEVTVRNPGSGSRQGWTVVLVMPSDRAVENRTPSLVTVTQQGDVVTIVPVAGQRELVAGGAVSFAVRFPALLALGQAARSCAIDGRPCAAA